jgi:hypothetical protein
MAQDDFTMAGATQEKMPEVQSEAQEIFPVRFDKDYKDFRPETGEAVDEVPKGWSARASVTTSTSPTGLEDVSREDLENPVMLSVVKGSQRTSSNPTESGKPTSSEATSTGNPAQPAEM